MKKTSLFWLAASLTTILALVAGAGCTLLPAPDTTAPAVASTVPADTSAGIAVNSAVTARFSEAMDPLTINTTTFTLKRGATPISGVVTYTGNTATFAPEVPLDTGTKYTATITTGVKDVAGNPRAVDHTWTFTTQGAPDTIAPTVTSTMPSIAATGVTTNSAMTANFSEAMDPLTVNTATFTLKRGTTPVSGAVTYAGLTATFTPAAALEPGTEYTATISTGARDKAGNALAVSKAWTFSTSSDAAGDDGVGDDDTDDGTNGDDTDDGTSGDTTAPMVTSTFPADSATSVSVNSDVTARFSEAMAPLTITTTTFTLKRGTTPVSGAVNYDGVTATFTPAAELEPDTKYTATITTGVEDLEGNPMTGNAVWTFRTLASTAEPARAPVNLGSAGDYVILAKTGISTTGTTSVVGDLGVSPAAATYITGFGLILHSSTEYSTSSLVTGRVYAADYSVPTPADLTAAIADMETAYTDAANRTLPDATGLGAGNIGGMTLAPGLYKWGTGVTIPAQLTLSGSADDVWIFQIAQTLNVGNGVHVTLTGGAQAKNIFWQVAGQTTLGTTSVLNGNVLCKTAIVMNSGARLNGRALAQTAVTMISNTVTLP